MYVWCKASDLYMAMSMPVGQSFAQALQLRQRSKASWTSGDVQPMLDDAAVEHLLQDPCPSSGGLSFVPCRLVRGHMNPPLPGQIGPALPDTYAAVQRIGDVAAIVRKGEPIRGQQVDGLRPAQLGVERIRSTTTPGFSSSVGVEECLECVKAAMASGSTWFQEFRRAPGRRRVPQRASRRSLATSSAASVRKRRMAPRSLSRGNRCARGRSRHRSGRRPIRKDFGCP